ncbi:MAG: molybdate ABC transporter substrate-binding protein [Bryobacteraceae bacterium]
MRAAECRILAAAAADLARAQTELSQSLARDTGCSLRFSLGSSGMLARQIENGAPFDVYLSANQLFVEQLTASRKLLPGSVRTYAVGRLGLWSRSGRIRSPEDLLKVRHVAIPNPLHAPYGVAAREALRKLGLWDRISGRIVYGENVQQAFQFAQTGNAEAVITAWALVYDRGGILLPAALHAPIRQAGGVVSASGNREAALRFLEWLTSPRGKQVLRRYGFEQ